MADKDEIKKRIKEEIARLDKESAKAYQEKLKALNAINASLDTYESLLSNIKNEVADINKGFSGILGEIKAIVGELEKGNKSTKDVTKAFKGLESIASKLKYDQQGYNELSLEQLKNEKSKLGILENQARAAAKQLAQDKGIVDLAKTNLSFRRDLTDEERAILEAAKEGFTIYEETNKLLKERIKEEEKINRKLGLTGVLLHGMGKIPIVGPLLKTNEALDAAKEKAKAGGNAFTIMGTAAASMGKGLLTSLMDPLTTIGLIVKAFQFLIELGFKVDKTQTELAKSFSLSSDSAERMYQSFNDIQATNQPMVKGLEVALLNTTRMAGAANELGQAFGGALVPTRSQIENQIVLTKQIGLSVEEANELQKLAFQNKMSADDITQEVLSQTKAYRNQTGVQLNNKKILQEISKVSGQLRLQYGNSVKELTSAVVQTQKLGISLEQSKKIAEGLLNFEESIENELSAELLIGRDLNLEQARLLALNGKSAEAVALLSQEMGGSAAFAAMNVIQQEQLAKALGMNADEMADMMIYQEQLNSLGEIQSQLIKDRIEELEKQGRTEEAQQLQRDISNGVAAEEALKRIDEQTKFNESIEKLKLLLADVVDGPAQALVKGITYLVSNSSVLLGIIKNIGIAFVAIKVGGILSSLATMVASLSAGAAAAFSIASALTLGIGLIAITAAVGSAIYSLQSQKEEVATVPEPKNIPGVKLAKGGVVKSRIDNATIGEAGPEAIVPLSSPAAQQMMGGGPIQVTVYGQIDKQTLFSFIAEGERTNSNNLGSERQINNRGIQ
jgi:hypothetical protein